MMSMSKQTKFILAIALQLIVIFAIIIFKLSILTGGTDALLRIKPVDPRDFLRGDYMAFQYDISDVSSYNSMKDGDTVYVSLWQHGKYWTAQKASKTKPSDNAIFLKGKVSREDDIFNENNTIHIVYGIEEYYIPEGKGGSFSSWDRNSEASAKVAIDENGNAVIKQIYLDGKIWPN